MHPPLTTAPLMYCPHSASPLSQSPLSQSLLSFPRSHINEREALLVGAEALVQHRAGLGHQAIQQRYALGEGAVQRVNSGLSTELGLWLVGWKSGGIGGTQRSRNGMGLTGQ